MRVEDAVWEDLLQHVRYRNCKQEHINLLRSLIVTIPTLPNTNYENDPWKSAVLVMPHHSVRKQWNTAAAKKMCVLAGEPLLVSMAIDTIEGVPLTVAERFAVMTKKRSKKDGGEERAGLMKSVEMAIGMLVMVTWNVHTELDVANGSREEIVGITLHPKENEYDNCNCI